MAFLEIKDFPDHLYDWLKERVFRNNRAVGDEVIQLLEYSLRENTAKKRAATFERIKKEVDVQLSISPVDMIREDRDA